MVFIQDELLDIDVQYPDFIDVPGLSNGICEYRKFIESNAMQGLTRIVYNFI